MFKKKSENGKSKFSLLGFLLHPGVKIFGGIFSLLVAVLFGGFKISRRRKKKATEFEAQLASSLLLVKLEDVRNQLGEFQVWLKKQDPAQMDVKETKVRYAALKNLYSEWTSHERMEEILGTVQYDPKIGMSVSNGLHELRSLNILMESILRDEQLGTPDGAGKLAIVDEHLVRALEFFNYINKDLENTPENRQIDTLKDQPE
ncbi:hypothetical protein NB640_12625 [Oxalobacter vibrioformis]|uniref:Uncharacterized protein n=1 Tax=Oxalobacter vibrioformis TaxID=933080 RepID=A0A9E9LVP0_9BURK|nr:hypothetical protein [Oxalobacter vibrioformis]WAW10041.1 hypothetical protein NB640_12625 [Oxalobacter vibrioformis]